MCYISKHHTKEKWKCYSSENTWIHLLISRYSISIDNLLWNSCVIISIKSCWRISKSKAIHCRCWYNFLKLILNRMCIFRWYKHLPKIKLLTTLELSQSIIENPFFPKINSPFLDIGNILYFIHKC